MICSVSRCVLWYILLFYEIILDDKEENYYKKKPFHLRGKTWSFDNLENWPERVLFFCEKKTYTMKSVLVCRRQSVLHYILWCMLFFNQIYWEIKTWNAEYVHYSRWPIHLKIKSDPPMGPVAPKTLTKSNSLYRVAQTSPRSLELQIIFDRNKIESCHFHR